MLLSTRMCTCARTCTFTPHTRTCRGVTNTFEIDDEEVGNLLDITIGHDGTSTCPSWHLDHVVILNTKTEQKYFFLCRLVQTHLSFILGRHAQAKVCKLRRASKQLLSCKVVDTAVLQDSLLDRLCTGWTGYVLDGQAMYWTGYVLDGQAMYWTGKCVLEDTVLTSIHLNQSFVAVQPSR